MKLLDKIKKNLTEICVFLLMIPTKVSAIEVLYGPPEPEKITKPSLIEIIWNIARNLIFPIVLLIGIIIYLKKAKDSKKNRIILSIGIIFLMVLLYFSISTIIVELGK